MIQTDTKKPTLQISLGGTVEKNIPENVEWIDDAFYVKETRFGLYVSILKNPLCYRIFPAGSSFGCCLVVLTNRWTSQDSRSRESKYCQRKP